MLIGFSDDGNVAFRKADSAKIVVSVTLIAIAHELLGPSMDASKQWFWLLLPPRPSTLGLPFIW